ncbi:MAG TPA: iron ABC transporter substrate-binding protein [Acidimicrobiales bacterium]|nr:iron ABC transporter substrate-binding protein [Acidimicrobiales bacterium]
MLTRRAAILVAAVLSATLVGCGDDNNDTDASQRAKAKTGSLTVYSGRNENLIRPLLDKFEKDTRIEVDVKYGDTAELLPTVIEEGERSPADVFISQDAGSLGELAEKGLLAPLPLDVINDVDERFRDDQRRWVGLSGRARVVVVNTDRVPAAERPSKIDDVLAPKWKGRIGFAPTNASFVAFVSALRNQRGEPAARKFLEGLKANGARAFDSNLLVVQAVARGEVDLGLVNHYYLYSVKKETPNAPIENVFTDQDAADQGMFVNVAGVGVLRTAKHVPEATRLVRYLLSESAQTYFRDKTSEYPLAAGVTAIAELPPLNSLRTPPVPLGRLGGGLDASVTLIKDLGLS